MNTQPPPGQQPGQTFNPQGPDAYATSGHRSQAPAQNDLGQSSAAPPPQHKPSWFARHKILTVLFAIVAVFVIYGAVNSGEEQSTDSTTAETSKTDETDAGGGQAADDAPPAEDSAPGIGDAVRDGKFEFTVTEIQPSVSEIGDDYLSEQAHGQFVLVHLTVSNIGDKSQMLFGDNQTLVDDQGREHAANTMAGIYLDDNDTFANEINPGNTVEGIVVFDIPADAVPTSIELHDSAFSGGVSVNLQ